MATKNYGFLMRIRPEQLESLDFVVETLTRVRDEFYKDRGLPPPKKPLSRQEALRDSLWLSEMVSRGQMIAVKVEDIKNGEFLKSDNHLTECFETSACYRPSGWLATWAMRSTLRRTLPAS